LNEEIQERADEKKIIKKLYVEFAWNFDMGGVSKNR
jgi:hypothetical protein